MKVQSSTISEISHDGKTLLIEFVHGGKYAYEDVPPAVFEAFAAAESKGKYFHAEIKGKYRYSKIC